MGRARGVGCWVGVVVVAGIAALAGCGSGDSAVSGSTPVESPPIETLPPVRSLAPVDVIGVYDDVGFYPACGNEVLDHRGVRWYTLTRVGSEPFDDTFGVHLDQLLAVGRAPAPTPPATTSNTAADTSTTSHAGHGFARVVEPGPGDDTGTLVVWADGVARWTSDSGNLDVWLVDDELDYHWVC